MWQGGDLKGNLLDQSLKDPAGWSPCCPLHPPSTLQPCSHHMNSTTFADSTLQCNQGIIAQLQKGQCCLSFCLSMRKSTCWDQGLYLIYWGTPRPYTSPPPTQNLILPSAFSFSLSLGGREAKYSFIINYERDRRRTKIEKSRQHVDREFLLGKTWWGRSGRMPCNGQRCMWSSIVVGYEWGRLNFSSLYTQRLSCFLPN